MAEHSSDAGDPSRPVGSDFSSPPADLLQEQMMAAPWVHRSPVIFVETGQQALAHLAISLGAAGRGAIAIPAFACQSMIDPFLRRGWSVRAFRVDGDLRPDWSQVVELIDGGAVDTVLAIRYFGAIPDDHDRAAVGLLRRRGAFVIADETHHPFHPFAWNASAAFASLRKTLPVADGAYLYAPELCIGNALGEPSDHGRWEVMDAFDAERGAAGRTRIVLDAANAALDSDDQPRVPGARTLGVLARLPYEALAARRAGNARALLDVLAGIDGLLTVTDLQITPVPSHVVVRTDNPRALQRRLARRRIYCPVHWPKPDGFADGLDWPLDLMSVPIDHRYDINDMRLVGAAIRQEMTR